jgi:dTDP-4-dehydrorhamnose reductase
LGVYARTKLAGERAVLSAGVDGYVFRLSWVYGLRGSNFLRTIRRLLAEGREVRIVADQYGSPTWCRVVAEATAQVVCQILRSRRMGSTPPSSGIYHMTGPDHTTWHGFAEAIVEMGKSSAEAGGVRVVPISTSDFPTTATRPRYSVLDSSRLARTFGLRLPPWREQLELCLGCEDGS